jgi:hypothetical protein
MSPLECDQKLEQIIREFSLRIAVPRWTEFDSLWEIAIRVCEQYQVGKSQVVLVADQRDDAAATDVTSSHAPSAADAPAQTHLPIAA